MNRVILSLLLFCSVAFAGDRPRGFLGINWGASPEEAKRVLQARPGVKFPEETDDYKFELTGGTFAGKAVVKWTLEFPERKFASATVTLKSEGDAPAMFKEFRTQLISKYGPATIDRKLTAKVDRKAPPTGERNTSQGNATTWKFTPNMKERSTVTIACELAGPNGGPAPDAAQLAVSVRYVNDTLLGAPAAAANAKPGQAPLKKEDL